MIKRRITKVIRVGEVKIGGLSAISIQSMAKTDTACVADTVEQIQRLERAGCEIVRVAVKNSAAAKVLDKIKARIKIPLVADIHFDYRLALIALERGVDKIRLNPGNIYRPGEVKQIALSAKKRKVPIRVGVNSGSLPGELKVKTRGPEGLAEAMVKSARDYIKMLERFNFYDIIVSLKASDVATTVEAYRKMSARCDYPLHLGITAAGLVQEAAIKSASGLGALLLDGIGDTLRVSLAGEPEEEVRVAKVILQSLGVRSFGPEIIVCPTCGRTQTDVVKIAQNFKKRLDSILTTHHSIRPLTIAIMGCEVNGPGEAQEADIGIACGKACGVLFKKGKIVKKVPESQIVTVLIEELKKYDV
ncbi:MAG: flavodoxin-dependent (E)-4-hydroxy-3-methylbut-2-enyl-diphosphate synthase [Candidatus Omnitrophota bacterium]